jgi:hypothetical protein
VVAQNIAFESSIIRFKPSSYAVFRLRKSALDDILRLAPMEMLSHSPATLTLPLPDGSFARYQIEESPIMEPELAKQFPMIKTYRGKGIDDPTATARFEQTPHGLHAMSLSGSGAFLVDAVGKEDGQVYVSYFKKDLPADPDQFACAGVLLTPGHHDHPGQAVTGTQSQRVYRIAVTASYRYVRAILNLNDPDLPSEDPLEKALEAIAGTINRVNTIYERDLNISLRLVNGEASIIHTDSAHNPYDDDSNDDDGLRKKNKADLNQSIGINNYDVGQLFLAPTKARGGSAEPCACSPQYKAWGLVGSPHPYGNAFFVQYVAHEIAHQFGASHSFNGTTGGCNGNRNPPTAYEPGSGSTIMGYSTATKICGAETIQDTADPYFHAISLDEIRTFITGADGDLCAQKRETGNHFVPVVDAGPNYMVPGKTPFGLSVRSSSDGDDDSLTFTWEEFDLGPPDPPNPNSPWEHQKKRPLFRSWEGSNSITRIFPAMNFIMNLPSVYVAEAMPTNNREMTFRVTARDGHGLYGFDYVTLTVITKRGPADVGPFAVTEPQAGAAWPRGSTQKVSWSVARTDLFPISCHRVRILFMIGGGQNSPIVLADNVPNSPGFTEITLPNDLPLTMGRIKVEAIGNIFFNISTDDIQIVN